MTQRWALLCGGDYYAAGTARLASGLSPPNLNGCVRDVKLVTALLRQFDVPEANIRTLTATVDCDGKPMEAPDHWPTRDNINRELRRIEEDAKSETKDAKRLLYFHYSGHGTLRSKEDCMPKLDDDGKSSDDFRGTALVMTDVASGGAYLTGRQLGLWIKQLVEESGFRVTVILDSCFSGDGFRNDDGDVASGFMARSLDEIDFTMLDSDEFAEEEAERAERDAAEGSRDAKVPVCWLSEPEGCTVVTACSRNQTAGEKLFGDGKQGILTYWLVDTLSDLRHIQPPRPSHARTVDYVRQKTIPRQTPMIYGQGLFEFFGLDSYAVGESCIARSDEKGIEIDVGRAQGVEIGSVYDVLPLWALNGQQHLGQIKVTSVGGFESRAEVMPAEAATVWPRGEARQAILHQWALPRDQEVRVYWPEDVPGRELLAAQLNGKPGLVMGAASGEPSGRDLVVRLDGSTKFHIFQNDARLERLPEISTKEANWPIRLTQILSHVTRFQALRRLYSSANTNQLRRWNFELTIQRLKKGKGSESETKEVEESEAIKEVEEFEAVEGDTIELSLHYQGSLSSLWVSLYYFSASWGITKMLPSSGTAAEQLDEQRKSASVRLKVSVPPKCTESDPDRIQDRIVFFISTAPNGLVPSWGDICLPSLGPTTTVEPREWVNMSPSTEADAGDDHRMLAVVKGSVGDVQQAPETEWAAVGCVVWTTGGSTQEDFI